MDSYQEFLRGKVKMAPSAGFTVSPDDVHPILLPHQRQGVVWACSGGRRALFEAFGLGKSVQQLEILRLCQAHAGGPVLVVVPLGVRQEFRRDAEMLGIETRFIRSDHEVDRDFIGAYLTNYESVRDGKLDPNQFTAASLDEASVLRSFGSKTYQTFLTLFDRVRFRFVATATPSPNRYKELIHYAGFLGIMDTGQALTRWFKRDSTQANNLTLHPHKEREFWLWIASWALFLQKPSDLGHSDEGYVLPDIKVHYVEVAVDHQTAKPDRDGQGNLFRDSALGVQSASREKRDTMALRVAATKEIVDQYPESHWIIWHDLEDEREAIQAAIPEAVSIYGKQDLDEREQAVVDFSEGRFRILSAKPVIAGSGCNFQRHCHRAIYAGIGFKFNDFIQSLHRIQRFQQSRPVEVWIVYAESEREILATLKAKWARHIEMVEKMSEIIREYGLSHVAMANVLTRAIGCERIEASGKDWLVANNDCVEECRTMEDNSVDLIVTSIPFSNHYEYSPSYNDFGHTDNNEHFWAQMDHLTPNLLRILRPGRIAAIHVKDRIQFGNVTGAGVPTVSPFHAETIMHYRAHGFDFMGMITVVTDVVRENNQTYRLGWSEQCKDATKMGCGSPEYIVLMHKPQTDRSRGYADVPVTKSKDDYSRSRWQIDAHAFWRSSGNRDLSPDEMAKMGPDKLAKIYTQYSLQAIYDYETHVKIGEALDARGALPSTFMSLAPGSHHPEVWHDVNRMLTLNGEQFKRNLEAHICLARGSLVLTKERGYVPIEAVQEGEHALTHKGRWRPVMVARMTGVKPAITVRAQGVPGLTLTPDHKLWSREAAGARARDGAASSDPEWTEAQDTLGDYVNLRLPDPEGASITDPRHWWIVGRWIADGHWATRGDAIISCGPHKIDGLRSAMGELFGAVTETGTCPQVRILDPYHAIRDTLERCGVGASDKQLPPEAFTLPVKQATALLSGYLAGDGHLVESRNRWMATTVSRSLALGMAMLAQRVLGVIASVHAGRPARESVIQGRTVQCRQEWVVSFDAAPTGRKSPFILDDGAWKKVRSLSDAGEQEVWCLRVAEDESFTAEGCVVKNCPLQFDIVDRLITRFSNQGELVFDPFGGLFTVPCRALKLGRKGRASELSTAYFLDGVQHVKAAEMKASMPDLFGDLEDAA